MKNTLAIWVLSLNYVHNIDRNIGFEVDVLQLQMCAVVYDVLAMVGGTMGSHV